MTAARSYADTAPGTAVGGRKPGSWHGGPVYQRLVALEVEGRARKGQRWRFPDGRVLTVIRVRDVAPDEDPVLGRWDDGEREDFGLWLCNIAELLPEDAAQPQGERHEEAHAEGSDRDQGRAWTR